MSYKNIHLTTPDQTVVPIYHIDGYQDESVKQKFHEYKFKSKRRNTYLERICLDLCISLILEHESDIIFTAPPSTMFYRKEKDIDSMMNLLKTVEKQLLCHFRTVENLRITFTNIFSINKHVLKNKKAQHIDGGKKSRTKNLEQRYYVNRWKKRYLKRKNVICIIDDVSSTGGTLLACKKCLEKYTDAKVELYSLAH